jgi:hypothetical protein
MGVLDLGKEETHGTTSTVQVQGLLTKLLTHPQPTMARSATYNEKYIHVFEIRQLISA